MVDIKEIASVEITSFTLIGASVRAIMAFIAAIILSLIFEVIVSLVPPLNAFRGIIAATGVALIIMYPIASFFINLSVRFYTAYLYNGLASRLSGIKLGLEGNELNKIPVYPFALILACIYTVWAFIIGLFLAASTTPFLAALTSIAAVPQVLTNATGVPITSATLATLGAYKIIFLIIGLPVMAFVLGFIFNALAAIFYNYIAVRVAKIKLDFQAVENNLQELIKVPVMPAALSVAVVAAVFGFLNGLGRLSLFSAAGDVGTGVIALIMAIIGYFIMTFIVMALGTLFYNYLAPRIGGIKLMLE